MESTHDPRDRLVREKHFTLRPKPLERWLWQHHLPQAAERVFWVHWEEGMRNRDWCSEIPLRRVAGLCCIDPSTVTRAYQLLKSLGLLRRQDPGRDPTKPFQQATAITEVRIPRELLTELSRSPNRQQIALNIAAPIARRKGEIAASQPGLETESVTEIGGSLSVGTALPESPRPTKRDIQALWGRVSTAERGRFFKASHSGTTALEFDVDSQLTPEDRGELLAQLEQMARARSRMPEPTKSVRVPNGGCYAKSRRLSPLDLARTRKGVLESVPATAAGEVLRQVVWAVEEGALRRFDVLMAVNIALKKIREGAWSRPYRMPPNWGRISASHEHCSAA